MPPFFSLAASLVGHFTFQSKKVLDFLRHWLNVFFPDVSYGIPIDSVIDRV